MNIFFRTFILILFLFNAIMVKGQTKEEAFRTIKEMRSTKQYTDALVLVERMLTKYPNDIDLLMEQAFLNDDRGERVQAFQYLFNAQKIYPDNDTVIGAIALLYRYSSMLDSSIANYRKCLLLADDRLDSFNALVNIGSIYLDQQKFVDAINFNNTLIKKFPDSVDILSSLSIAYAESGQQNKAAILMERIIKLNPRYPHAYSSLGLLYTKMNNYSAAEIAFQKGLALSPKDAILLNNYGYLFYKTKEYNKALLYINKSINEYGTNAYAYRNRALVYIDLNLIKEACADLNASLELGFKTYYGNEVDQLKSKHCK